MVGQVVPANQVPPVVLLTGTLRESISNLQKGWILEALDLKGVAEWPEPEQETSLGSCCLSWNTYLPAVTWTWEGLL